MGGFSARCFLEGVAAFLGIIALVWGIIFSACKWRLIAYILATVIVLCFIWMGGVALATIICGIPVHP